MAGSIATRRGDDATTGLLYGGRVPKDHPQVEAIGAFDEVNVEIGAVRLMMADGPERECLLAVQKSLVALMGELACAPEDLPRYEASTFAKIGAADLALIDGTLAAVEGRVKRLGGWATPGATPLSTACDRARVTARRAERRLTSLVSLGHPVRPLVLKWVNRLSDLLWILAREAEPQA